MPQLTSPSFFLFLLVLLLANDVLRLDAITTAIDDVNITALKQLCDKFKHEHFDIVYDEYGWSLEKDYDSDGLGGDGGGDDGSGAGRNGGVNDAERKINTTNTSINHLKGFCVDIFKEFVRFCPIDYRLYQNDDGLWGNYDEKKKAWDGMIGKLVDGKADMGMRERERDKQTRRPTDTNTNRPASTSCYHSQVGKIFTTRPPPSFDLLPHPVLPCRHC